VGKPQVPLTNYLYSPIPLYKLYNIKVHNTISVLLSDNERKNNKNTSIATKSIFKSVHKTLVHKLKPFIGSCYTLHTRYGKSKKHLKNPPRQSGRPQIVHRFFQ